MHGSSSRHSFLEHVGAGNYNRLGALSQTAAPSAMLRLFSRMRSLMQQISQEKAQLIFCCASVYRSLHLLPIASLHQSTNRYLYVPTYKFFKNQDIFFHPELLPVSSVSTERFQNRQEHLSFWKQRSLSVKGNWMPLCWLFLMEERYCGLVVWWLFPKLPSTRLHFVL